MSKWKKGPGTTYGDKLKDPRWQKRRLEILERDEWTCRACHDKTTTLHVHHRYYEAGAEPWDSPAEALITLCEQCHTLEGEFRQTVEQEILKLLRTRLLVSDLDCLLNVFEWMPAHVTEALAKAPLNMSRFAVVEEWMRHHREMHESHTVGGPT